MAQAVRGFPLRSVYSGGFSVICLICHFNAPVRRFNYGRCPYIPPALCALYALFMVLLRGVVPCPAACRLCGALPACPHCAPPLWPCYLVVGRPAPAVRSRGSPVAASPCVALRQSRRKSLRESRESRWHSCSTPCESRCESRKRGAKVAHLPQNHSRLQNPVYKGGIFPAATPPVHGKSCKSRSVSAHFTSKSLAAMYFCWSCSGVKPSSCGWFGVITISCLSTMP